ncbi:MAG: GTP cyclohydrolase I FolE2 [Candidatus Altiarchaeota archaeon]|nr:GTP cyclohydrolase I FolE2 [Candidatus Altiarchaeota archaeon]
MKKETQEYTPQIPESLNRVGITNLRILVKTGKENKEYRFVPKIEITIDLPREKKGVHMSRLVESIAETVSEEAFEKHMTFEELEKNVLEKLREKHPYKRGEVSMATELVIKKRTPVSRRETMETHDVLIKVIYEKGGYRKVLKVKVLGNTVCPHSLENTKRPHIQRAIGELEIETGINNQVILQDMVECVEKSFSTEVYTLIKTEDENHMVERMYENPMFVEDVTRAILNNARGMFKDCKIRAKTTAQESIHRHDVIAEGEVSS